MPPAEEGAATPPQEPGLRAATLAAAARLLAEKGAAGFSVRQVAAAAGCSTMAVYHYFGSKQELVDGVFAEGFTRLAEAQRTTPADGSAEDRVRAICHGLRTMALASPTFYQVMFGHPVAGIAPTAAARTSARENYGRFVDVVKDWATEVELRADPVTAAHLLWACGHGHVIIELTGQAPNADHAGAYAAAVDVLIAGLHAAPGRPA